VGQQLQERRPEQERKARLEKKKQPIYNLPHNILFWMPLLFLVSFFFPDQLPSLIFGVSFLAGDAISIETNS
jgi:hypothetical protein